MITPSISSRLSRVRLFALEDLFAAFVLAAFVASSADGQQAPLSTKAVLTRDALLLVSQQLDAVDVLPASRKSVEDTTSFPQAFQCLDAARKAARQANVYSFGCLGIRRGLRTAKEADEFFGALNTGGVVALSVGSEQSALYSEIVSDNIWLAGWAGFARVGLSAQVGSGAATDSSTVTQFFQGGGNAVLYGAAPLLRYLNFARPEAPMLLRRVDIFTIAALGADIPKLGSDRTDPASSARLGFALQAHWNTHQSLMRFFVDANAHYVKGLSAAFYENLTGDTSKQPLFLSATATVGVDLRETVRVGIRFAGSELVGQRPQFSVQFLQK